MSDINWQQTRNVFEDRNGELWVQVETGYMLLDEYIEGGTVYSILQIDGPLEMHGRFSNAQISNGDAHA